ncbi:DNA-binding HxlR family transcriptional regulator [Rhizobium leguminosarum]|uniref:DNA-binding HxlR family transcriptional regulator n=2 Tax=Rhizobium/Agrobacterium group TaxID=227290 RepID=A0AAE2SUP3_RHILE|nr:DNA-binding HxlR family transcriptional regulator [Rhizobium leguminosarum]MDF9818122.1 DNA-binding HxlR family transcriptional regulator [Rhizobium leguminosarum]
MSLSKRYRMKNSPIPQCPVARGLKSVGDAWSILVLRDAHTGLTRFDQFRKSLGIVPTMLTKRLKALTDDGLLEKRLYSERPPREEYVLTAAGRDFLPVLIMIGAWAHRHCDGDLARYVDVESGLEIEPIAIDAVSGAKLGTRAMRLSSEQITETR